MRRFLKNRIHAGQLLAEELGAYQNDPGVLVLALPRGGVPVAEQVARKLNAPLDVFLVRKLGVPGQEELAMGAIASGGGMVLNDSIVSALGITDDMIRMIVRKEEQEMERREKSYRGDRPPPALNGKTIILVDDGLATGSSMLAAIKALRREKPLRIVAAVPVAPPSTCQQIKAEADEVVCLLQPEPFFSVGLWYEDFRQTTDEEVIQALRGGDERYRKARQGQTA